MQRIEDLLIICLKGLWNVGYLQNKASSFLVGNE